MRHASYGGGAGYGRAGHGRASRGCPCHVGGSDRCAGHVGASYDRASYDRASDRCASYVGCRGWDHAGRIRNQAVAAGTWS